jgi:hypothetical protein
MIRAAQLRQRDTDPRRCGPKSVMLCPSAFSSAAFSSCFAVVSMTELHCSPCANVRGLSTIPYRVMSVCRKWPWPWRFLAERSEGNALTSALPSVQLRNTLRTSA